MEPNANFIVKAFADNGVFMYFILAFAVMTLGLILERGLFFALSNPTPPSDFRQRVLENVLRGDVRAAEVVAQGYSKTALGRIVAVGLRLRAAGSGDEEVQARMDERLQSEISRIDRRTGFLAMFGNVSTLFGLLGTIVGMIHSFGAVALASPADRATMLSKGISEAMNCTAFGLITAIPALIAYAYFQNRTDRALSELTERTTELYHDLVFLAEPSARPLRAAQPHAHAAHPLSN